jgi:hypothetical protein
MNHSLPGVNAGYITRHKLLEDHLRRQQQAISSAVFAALGGLLTENLSVRQWLGREAFQQDFPKSVPLQIDVNVGLAVAETALREAAEMRMRVWGNQPKEVKNQTKTVGAGAS